MALLLGLAEVRRALDGATLPGGQTLPLGGVERVNALQLAIESLLFAQLLAPEWSGRAVVAVAIQAVRLAAWVVFRAKQREDDRL